MRARERIIKMMEKWSEHDRRCAVEMLRNLADEIEAILRWIEEERMIAEDEGVWNAPDM